MKDEALLWHDSCHGNIVITLLMACLLWATVPSLIIYGPKFSLARTDAKGQALALFRATNATFPCALPDRRRANRAIFWTRHHPSTHPSVHPPPPVQSSPPPLAQRAGNELDLLPRAAAPNAISLTDYQEGAAVLRLMMMMRARARRAACADTPGARCVTHPKPTNPPRRTPSSPFGRSQPGDAAPGWIIADADSLHCSPAQQKITQTVRNPRRARLHKLIEKNGRATGKEREEAQREEFRERTLVFVPEFRKYL